MAVSTVCLYCIWGSLKTYSTETGPYPLLKFANCSWGFSYFSCCKPLRESTRDVFEKQTQETVHELSLTPKNISWQCRLWLCFWTTKLKTFFFEKSKLIPSPGLRILPLFGDSKIDLGVVDDVTMSDTPPRGAQCQTPLPVEHNVRHPSPWSTMSDTPPHGVSVNPKSVCLWQNFKKTALTLKSMNKLLWKWHHNTDTMFRFSPIVSKSTRRLLVHQCHLLPLIAPRPTLY